MPTPDSRYFEDEAGVEKLRKGSRFSVDYRRLRESMDWSSQQMEPFRAQYVEAVQLCAGSRYGNSMLDKSPLNFFRLAVGIWLRQLVSQSPRALVLTKSPSFATEAYELELALNQLLKDMRFGEALSEAVRSALFLFGVMKVGITPSAPGGPYSTAQGLVYADPVLVEDFLFDMNARRSGDWEWCGNLYRVRYDEAKENPNFDSKVRAKLHPEGHKSEEHGGGERTTDMSTGESLVDHDFREYVDLWDIWIPGDNLLVTLPAQTGLPPLQVREWEGPEKGPFHLLSFASVPGNAMPVAPSQSLYDLQNLITHLFNKLARQAMRQKSVTIADGAAVADGTATRIREADDGEIIQSSHIDGVREMSYGNINPANMQFAIWLKDIFSYMGGNLDAMGGLSSQAGTLGQEQLLVQSSSEMLRDMQNHAVEFTTRIMSDIAWYLYTDPVFEMKLAKDIEGFGKVPFVWGPDRRKADFFEYNLELSPYSLRAKDPQQRLGALLQIVQTIVLPLSNQMSEWGMPFNLKRFMELISKYADLPELQEIISSPEASADDVPASPPKTTPGRRPLQSPATSRTYVRKNTGGGQAAAVATAKMMEAVGSAGE